MKPTHTNCLRAALLLALLTFPAQAQSVSYDSGTLNAPIPDDTDTGIAHTLDVTESFAVADIRVSLNLTVPSGETGWSGDLYAYLQHDAGLSVLLNRPGRSDTRPLGYSDNQAMRVSLRDDAANGDIHTYRTVATGSEDVALVGLLGGAWQPDGRSTDPASVVSGDPRPLLLGQFTGLDSAGTWTLFLADLSGGGRFQLESWALELSPTQVPEPAGAALVAVAGLVAATLARRGLRKGNRKTESSRPKAIP